VTDQELVERARDGDVTAFDALVSRHHRAVVRAALAALGSAVDADDVAQEAWIAAHARLAHFRGESNFRTWLLTIVWNKARDRRRHVGRWLQRLVRLDARWNTDPADGPREADRVMALASMSTGGASPEEAVLSDELAGAIRRTVRALPARLRDPLLLIGSGEYSYDEVAAIVGRPVGTVKWCVAEARRLLRVKLQRLGY
jgi:RNA polymerase sigma-70 factor, ECF subfamily